MWRVLHCVPMQLGYTILYVPDVPAALEHAITARATPMA